MKASNNDFPSVLFSHTSNSAIATPDVFHSRVFPDDDGTFKIKDSTGSVSTLGGGAINVDDVVTSASKLSFASNFVISDQGSGEAAVNIYLPTGGGSVNTGTPYEVEYAAVTTATTNITSTSAASPDTLITASGVAFDGSTIALIEVEATCIDLPTNNDLVISLWDDTGGGAANIGQLAQVKNPDAATVQRIAFSRCIRLTPSSATHTLSVRAHLGSAGTAVLRAGAGGSGTYFPAYIRVSKLTA